MRYLLLASTAVLTVVSSALNISTASAQSLSSQTISLRINNTSTPMSQAVFEELAQVLTDLNHS